MAVYKRDIVDINLETGNIHRSFLKHSIGYKDQKADHFGIRTYRDGVPVDLTGVSVQGIFLPPQGDPIAITSGNIVDGNVAEVVLPQACYNYDGQFTLSIKLVDSNNSVTGTMRIVDGMVDNTHASGTVAPTSAVPTYQEILSTYDEMVAATAAANGCIAATYSSSSTYKVGDYCIHDGGLYRCTTAITTAEAWTSGHWTAAKIGPDVSDLKSAIDTITGNEILSFTNGKYINTNVNVGDSVSLTPIVGTERNNYVIVDATEGDIFTINGTGGNAGRLWAYVDSSNKLISKAGNAEIGTDLVLTAPQNSSKLILNILDTPGVCCKGIYLNTQVLRNEMEFDGMRSAYTDNTPIDLSDPYTLYIDGSNLWNSSGSPSPKSSIEPIPDGTKRVHIIANNDANAQIAFLKNSTHTLNTTPNYADGTGKIVIYSGTDRVLDVPSDATYIYVFLSRSGTTYKPSIANYESYQEIPYARIDAIENKIGNENNTSFTRPVGGNAVKNVAFPITANRSIMFYWETNETGENGLNLYTRLTTTGSNVDELIENARPGVVYTVTPEHDANYLRIVANATGEITWLYADTITADLLGIHDDITDLQKHSTSEPLVNFEYDRTMIDASDIVSKFGLTTDTRNTMFSAVYNAFSELAQSYPSYVTEILDAVNGKDGNTPTGLEYPWYANGITANTTKEIPVVVDEQGQTTQTVTYTFTKDVSAYKVRLYKLSDTNPALPSSGKKKVFIIGGLHGNEVVAPINLYVLAKRLCNPVGNADLLKLRASCDFYIIPYLNGFGGQYLARVNGNLTDINRNFPTSGWTKTTITESTFNNLATCTFSGKAPGSEFETQLVMALHEQIKPNVFIDHHNSGTGNSQFYSVVTNSLVGNTIYQALTDCASAFLENLPQYFGTVYKLFAGSDVSPGTYTGTVGNSDRWSYEQGVITSGTCEIFEAINFLNGVYNPSPTKYNADSFSVGEYTLRNVILHLCQYMLKH